jgi:hypothetical protein
MASLFQKLSHLWGIFFLLLFQICDVPKVVFVNKNIEPNLAKKPQ